LAARLLRLFWLVVLIPAALAAAVLPGPIFHLGAAQPYHRKVVLLFIECLALALCYVNFDVLTTFWAVYTFAFCWQNYGLLVMIESAGNAEQRIAFVVFGLFVLAATTFGFKATLKVTYRRAVAAFE
jgi:hypothetical protein